MGFQRHLEKTLLTISKYLIEPLKSKECTGIQSIISSFKEIPSSCKPSSLYDLMPKSIAGLDNFHVSCRLPTELHNTATLAPYKHLAMPHRCQSLIEYHKLDSIFPSLSNLSCPNNSRSKISSLFSERSEKEPKSDKHISHSTYLVPTQCTNHLAAVFQCFPPLGPARTANLTIKHRTNFHCHPPHNITCRMKHTKPKVPPTKISQVYDYEGAITDQQAAEEFVFALKTSERQHLFAELAKYHGLDRNVVLHQTFPFLGFGFLDNLLMIVAGEYIDVTLGATLGISTMAAAALGNLISDVGGLGSAHYVETLAARVGVRNPHLSPEQVEMRRTKWASNLGKFIGVTIGCLLGMFPLLFFHEKKSADKDNEDPDTSEKKEEKAKEKIVDPKSV